MAYIFFLPNFKYINENKANGLCNAKKIISFKFYPPVSSLDRDLGDFQGRLGGGGA